MKNIIVLVFVVFGFTDTSFAQLKPQAQFTASVNLQSALHIGKIDDFKFGTIYLQTSSSSIPHDAIAISPITGQDFYKISGNNKSATQFVYKGAQGMLASQGSNSYIITYPFLPIIFKNNAGNELQLKIDIIGSRFGKQGVRKELFSYWGGILTVPANTVPGIYKNEGFDIMLSQQ